MGRSWSPRRNAFAQSIHAIALEDINIWQVNQFILKATATLMITMFYMKDLNKPCILIPVPYKSVEKRRRCGGLNICKRTVIEAAILLA